MKAKYTAVDQVNKRAALYHLMEANSILLELFDAELHKSCGVGIEWYDVLIKLWIAPQHTLRMAELAEQVLLSKSWLTRRINKLEDEGLVARKTSADDKRSVTVTLTKHGAEVFAKLEEVHARSIAEHFSQYINAEEAQVLMRCARRLASGGRGFLQNKSYTFDKNNNEE